MRGPEERNPLGRPRGVLLWMQRRSQAQAKADLRGEGARPGLECRRDLRGGLPLRPPPWLVCGVSQAAAQASPAPRASRASRFPFPCYLAVNT